LAPREATIKAMEEITGPVVGISLVLASVFIPTAFIPGLVGQFFRQFALTIATAALFSATNALTMAPARAVACIRPHKKAEAREALPRVGIAVLFGILAVFFLAPLLGPMVGVSAEVARLSIKKTLDAPLAAQSLWAMLFVLGGALGWFLGPAVNKSLAAFFG